MLNRPKLERVLYDAFSTISYNQEQDTWNYLKYCENTDNLIEYYNGNTGIDANTRRIEHVRLCLIQARNYFEAAKDAPVNIRPLIMYYGISCFAKAIILFHAKENPCQIRNLQSGHGLSLKGDSILLGFDRFAVEVNSSGSFFEFNNTIKNLGYFEVDEIIVVGEKPTGSKYFKYKATESEILSGRQFQLKNLLACLPELSNHYYLNYKERNNAFMLDKVGFRKDIIEYALVSFDRISYTKVTDAIMQEYFSTRPQIKNINFSFRITEPLPPIYISLTGEQYLISDISAVCLNEMSVYYQISYILGMLVRYRPEIWKEVLSQKGNLIQGFLDLCQIKFPLLALNILTQTVFTFGITASSIWVVTGLGANLDV
jgi:YaaC-like Protein